jgi:hypothetical protein
LKAFRIFQVVFILFGLLVVAFAMGLTDPDPAVRRLAAWLLGSSSALGAGWCLSSYLWLRARSSGNAAMALGKLMLIGLPVSTLLLFGTFYGVDFHAIRATLTVAGSILKLAFGFFAGWLWVVVLLYLIQLVRPAPVEDDDEEDDDEGSGDSGERGSSGSGEQK